MRVLNIAPRQSGKTTICYKHFLESYKKDPFGTWLIVAAPYPSHNRQSCHTKLIIVNSIFKLGADLETLEKSIGNIIYSPNIMQHGLRGCAIRNLFVDDYSWAYMNGRFNEDICYRADNIEMWSDQFLNLNEFNILIKRNTDLNFCGDCGNVVTSKFKNSCIYKLNFEIVPHSPHNWCNLMGPFMYSGTTLREEYSL